MRWIFFLLLFALSDWLSAQNIGGTWTGILDQSESASRIPGYQIFWDEGIWKKGEVTHTITLHLRQSDKLIDGEYHIQYFLHPQYQGKFSIIGDVQKQELHFRTTVKLEDISPEGARFCFIKGTLKYYIKDDYEYLEGTVHGWINRDQCSDAYVRMRRKREVKKA